MAQDQKVVTEHDPADRLPDALRDGIDPAANVTVLAAVEDQAPHRPRPFWQRYGRTRWLYATPRAGTDFSGELQDDRH
jgi:hypothetical protein